MQHYVLLMALCIAMAFGCDNHKPDDTATAETDTTENMEPGCSFQMQAVQGLPQSNHKVVSGLRQCFGPSVTSKEIILFAHGEPIDNQKQCNLFATTDTSITWELKLAQNKIDVYFNGKQPEASTILMQANTVADSIAVTYQMINPALN